MSTIPPPPPPPVVEPASPAPLPPAVGPVPNHLVWAIVATVLGTCFCCPLGLLGIVAIVYAAKVNSLLNAGDLEGARRASATAKTWCWVATALAIIGLLMNIYFVSTGGMAEYQQMLEQIQQAQ